MKRNLQQYLVVCLHVKEKYPALTLHKHTLQWSVTNAGCTCRLGDRAAAVLSRLQHTASSGPTLYLLTAASPMTPSPRNGNHWLLFLLSLALQLQSQVKMLSPARSPQGEHEAKEWKEREGVLKESL